MNKKIAFWFSVLVLLCGFARFANAGYGQPTEMVIQAPFARTMTVGNAYQATAPGFTSFITVNLTSTSTYTLGGTSNNEGAVYVGSTAGVATSGGTPVCQYDNTVGGGIAVAVGQTFKQTQGCTVVLAPNQYMAVRQTLGTGLTIKSAFEQPTM